MHAHSVFSHSPLHVIEECFAHVGRILAPGGWFDFTFDRTEGKEHQVLREDFYYRTETLIDLAATARAARPASWTTGRGFRTGSPRSASPSPRRRPPRTTR